jgi:hypothetical protein
LIAHPVPDPPNLLLSRSIAFIASMSLTFDFPNWHVGIGDQQQQAMGQQQQKQQQQQQEWAADLAVSCMLLACV